MAHGRDNQLNRIQKALEIYFDADRSPIGASDVSTVMTIIKQCLDEPTGATNVSGPPPEWTTPGVVNVEGEGLNIAFEYGASMDNGVFKSWPLETRVEILEACIYALNTRLNDMERGSGHDKQE
tara:strand:+ start:827 stop:1198 length:372 start_codon:yes stop_codon:yes gene_type:complete